MSEPWQLSNYQNVRLGTFARRETAQNFADKYDRRGRMTVRHTSTGETWARNRGSWFVQKRGAAA